MPRSHSDRISWKNWFSAIIRNHQHWIVMGGRVYSCSRDSNMKFYKLPIAQRLHPRRYGSRFSVVSALKPSRRAREFLNHKYLGILAKSCKVIFNEIPIAKTVMILGLRRVVNATILWLTNTICLLCDARHFACKWWLHLIDDAAG